MVTGRFPVISQTFVLNQVVGLVEAGHHVDIFTFSPAGAGLGKIHPAFELYGLARHTFQLPCRNRGSLSLVLGFFKQLLLNGYKNPSEVSRLFKRFNLRRAIVELSHWGQPSYDIIHCQFGLYARWFLPYLSGRLFQGKLVVSFRGFDISKIVKEEGRHYYDELFKRADLCLPNCGLFKQRLLEMGCDESKIKVYRSAIDGSKFKFSIRPFDPDATVRVLCVGRLVEKKGMEFAIRGFAEAAHVHANMQMDIVGDGPLRESLRQWIGELNLEDRIHLLGEKNQDEIIRLLGDSHLFIASSVTPHNGDQEGPVNTLKEAMATGLPVIGTRHGGIPELIEDGVSGFLVPERDPIAIAEKLLYLIDHPEEWVEMGKKGRARVDEHFNLKKLNAELIENYRELTP